MPSRNPIDAPPAVTSAVRLIYVTLAIGIARTILDWPKTVRSTTPGFALLSIVLVFGLVLWLASRVARGRSWARVTYLVLFAIGAPFSVIPLLKALGYSPFSAILGVVQLLLQGISLVVLFGREARPWFRPPPPGASA